MRRFPAPVGEVFRWFAEREGLRSLVVLQFLLLGYVVFLAHEAGSAAHSASYHALEAWSSAADASSQAGQCESDIDDLRSAVDDLRTAILYR